MENQIINYNYEGQVIEFDISSPNLMVNATEMAQIFNKKTNDFLRLDQTKAFIQECLSYGNSRNSDTDKNGNSRFLGIESEEDIVQVNHRHGTWMHRVIALKFAAWLDPKFELWVYLTIDQIMQAQGPISEEDTQIRKEALEIIGAAQEQIRQAHERIKVRNAEDQQIIVEATLTINQQNKRLAKLNRTALGQLNLFATTQSARVF